jgi:zinc transport system ATP-binding protein
MRCNDPVKDPAACRHCCIKINDLSVTLANTRILEKIDLHIHCGEVLAVVGPNGAGKTTLLRAILGEVPYEGDMESLLAGAHRRKPRIGYVPQKLHFDTDAPISVLDMVTAATSQRPVWLNIDQASKDNAQKILAVFSADHLIDRKIGELSGGELQRVLLAMAMTSKPELLLLDEPSTGVDVKGLELFYQIVRDLKKQHDISVIIVTHDLAGIAAYVDRIIVMNRSIIAQGTPARIMADKNMLQTFAPTLWNISSLPTLPSKNGELS